MPLTHFLANQAIDFIRTTYPATYIGLFTATPNLTGGGTEVTGGSYARLAFDSDDYWDAAVNSETDSDTQVAFVTPTASWGTIVAIGLFDAITSGNLLAYYTLPTPIPVSSGDNIAFPVGNLILANDS